MAMRVDCCGIALGMACVTRNIGCSDGKNAIRAIQPSSIQSIRCLSSICPHFASSSTPLLRHCTTCNLFGCQIDESHPLTTSWRINLRKELEGKWDGLCKWPPPAELYTWDVPFFGELPVCKKRWSGGTTAAEEKVETNEQGQAFVSPLTTCGRPASRGPANYGATIPGGGVGREWTGEE